MNKASSFPTLDLAQVDAVIFDLHELVDRTARAPEKVQQEFEAETFSSLLALVRELRTCGIKTAIVTASKNGLEELVTAGLSEIFDERVDEHGACQYQLTENPEPDVFLKLAELLMVSPERTAVFEDIPAGVQAGRAGKFGLIIGIDRATPPKVLKAQGADLVVADLYDFALKTRNGQLKRNAIALPSGLEDRQDMFQLILDKPPVVFLDYDGTLTPIVERPELALLPEHTRRTLRQLVQHCTVGIISGRDRTTVHQLVNVDSLVYAGSHGFDISGPKDGNIQYEIGSQYLPVLDQVEAWLHERLHSVPGVLIERKKFSVAVHYRLVATRDLDSVRSAVNTVVSHHSNIRIIEGKKLFDLQPRIDWDKGKALFWLLQALNLTREQVVPFFLGDDLTDEDAFKVLQDDGIGITVEDTSRFTYATYRLNNPDEVDQFLRYLINFLRRRVL